MVHNLLIPAPVRPGPTDGEASRDQESISQSSVPRQLGNETKQSCFQHRVQRLFAAARSNRTKSQFGQPTIGKFRMLIVRSVFPFRAGFSYSAQRLLFRVGKKKYCCSGTIARWRDGCRLESRNKMLSNCKTAATLSFLHSASRNSTPLNSKQKGNTVREWARRAKQPAPQLTTAKPRDRFGRDRLSGEAAALLLNPTAAKESDRDRDTERRCSPRAPSIPPILHPARALRFEKASTNPIND